MSFFCLSIFRLLKNNPAIRNRLSVYERILSRRGFALLRREIDCLRRGFLSFCGRVSMSRARLTRKNSFFPPALRSVRSSRPAQSALTEKRGFRWRELNFIWVQRHAAARFTSLIRKMCTPHFRGNAWQKRGFAALYYTLSVVLCSLR